MQHTAVVSLRTTHESLLKDKLSVMKHNKNRFISKLSPFKTYHLHQNYTGFAPVPVQKETNHSVLERHTNNEILQT